MNRLNDAIREVNKVIKGKDDVVIKVMSAILAGGHVLIALCNWEKPMIRFDDYEWLLFCAKQARIRADYCMLISAQGFDEKLKFASSSKKNITLVTLDNM